MTPEDENEESDDMSEDSPMQLKVATIIPLHDATGSVKRGRGRPRKINPKPTPDDLAYHAEMQRHQVEFVQQDEVLAAVSDRRGSAEVLHLLKQKIARDAAVLDFHRMELQKYGKTEEASAVAKKHIAALKEIAQLELQIRALNDQIIDLRGEKFQKIFSMMVAKFRDVAKETLNQEHFDLLFVRLENALENWEDEAEGLIR